MAYGPKGRIQPRKKPKKAVKAGASKVTTGGGAGRAIGSGLSKRVGKGVAGKAGRTIGGAGRTPGVPFLQMSMKRTSPTKPKRKPAKRKSRR